MFIFDCHVHLPSPGLGYTWEWQPHTPSLPAAVAYLRKCGIRRVLANSARGEVAQTVAEMVAGNDEIIQISKEYPDFIIPACLINTNFPEASQAELRRCREEHYIVWVGELCGYAGNYSYNTPAFSEAVRLATQLNMVIHIHSDDIDDMERLCREFPEATLVLAHLGDEPDQVTRRVELAKRHPNLYLDICGNGFERMGVLEMAVRAAGAERVLFGSDFTINDPSGVISRIQYSSLDEEAQRKILGGNLLRMFGERGVSLPETS